jgi:DNA-binding IclR family transcriptional regulator
MDDAAEEGRILGDARYRIPSLERALRVLEHLDRRPGGRTLVDLARDLRLPKNSVFRITTTLLRHGYLDRDPEGKRFALSRKVLALGYGSASGGGLVQRALGPMQELRDAVRETVVLSLLVDGEGFVLDQVQGTHPFRFVAESGARQPLHASASAKAILAFLPEGEREALLGRAKLDRLTPRTLTSPKALLDDLHRIRRRGYALDRGEHMQGVHCVAAPILDRRGYPVASITVTGPVDRLPESSMDTLGKKVRECAGKVSQNLRDGL